MIKIAVASRVPREIGQLALVDEGAKRPSDKALAGTL